jgi:pimeloyl-ACP methyl ester carboxylesterase
VDVARIDELKASEDSSDDEMLRENQSHDSSERGRRRPRFCAIAQLYRKDEYVPAFSHIEIADGRIWLLRDGIDCFAGDLTDEEKELTWATAMAPVAELFTQKVEGVAWRTKPSWYIVANNDRTVHPDLERFAANRMGATTSDVDSSHVPMLSHPELVLDVIRDAAGAVQESAAAVV